MHSAGNLTRENACLIEKIDLKEAKQRNGMAWLVASAKQACCGGEFGFGRQVSDRRV